MATTTLKRRYWCHDCRKYEMAESSGEWGPYWYCQECGHTIQCDECGQDWTNDHTH